MSEGLPSWEGLTALLAVGSTQVGLNAQIRSANGMAHYRGEITARLACHTLSTAGRSHHGKTLFDCRGVSVRRQRGSSSLD